LIETKKALLLQGFFISMGKLMMTPLPPIQGRSMVSTISTPGVYINDVNAFPHSVVPVATAVPAFIGYTPKARLNE
jgi:hypothetical protein